MKDYLDSLVNSLSNNYHKANCKHCMKCKDFKEREECVDDCFEGCEICKDCKKLPDYCKDCNKIYEDWKCYLEYVELGKKNFKF